MKANEINQITAFFMMLLGKFAELPRSDKQLIVLILDIIFCIQATWIAYSLRIGVWVYWDIAIQKVVLTALVTMIPVFYFMGIYASIFRYAGSGMMKILARVFLICSIATEYAREF